MPRNKTPFFPENLKAHRYMVFIAMFAILLSLPNCSCDKKGEESDLDYPLQTAQLISHATSGIIAKDGMIQVKFVSPVIKQNLVGQQIKKDVFFFEPGIDGVSKWEDRQTLVFKPNRDLPLRQKYEGKLELALLLPLQKEKLDPFAFRFEVAGREIAKVNTDFILEKEGNPKRMLVTGTVEFTENVPLDALKKAAVLKKNKRGLGITWEGAAEGKRFTFISDVFERATLKADFSFKIEKSPLDISDDYKTQFTLTPLSDMATQAIVKQQDNQRSTIIIEFSDEPDSKQDITGLISVKPSLDFKMKTVGKKVYLTGDFKNGESYEVIISKGLRSRWSTVTTRQYSKTIKFDELKPQMRFASDGAFLPTANQRRIRFSTVNLSKVRIEVKKVFENNLGQFLQTEQLNSNKTRNDQFNNSYTNRVGVVIHKDTLVIGAGRNEWVQNELDLTPVIAPNDDNLYLVHLSFKHEDMMYGNPEDMEEQRNRYYHGQEYYSNPYSHGYLYSHGNIYKPLILSDIGLTYKKAHNQHIIYATNIGNAQPVGGVQVTLKTYQNQEIASKGTDSNGYVSFDSDEDVFYVEATKNGQRSVIKPGEMAWNMSTFDTDGVADVPGGTRAFIYSERGVYRPGDEVNLSIIARNDQNTFPDGHPVTVKIFNPKRQKAFEETKNDGKDGFYNFRFQSGMDDPTGNWRVEAKIGSNTFYHTLKIETVVPFRLKVNLSAEKSPLTAADQSLRAKLKSAYLFGNPAANLGAEVHLRLKKTPKTFRKYKGFIFSNETVDFVPIEKQIFKGQLDGNGEASVRWTLPSLDVAPSALTASLEAKVFEKGGRPNTGSLNIPVEPYQYYVGLQQPTFNYGYARIGEEAQIPAILVDQKGSAVPGKPLQYRIYRGMYYWWWEYNDRQNYYLRFKTHESTELVYEGELVSGGVPQQVVFTPEQRGTYFIEVQDGGDGHTAGVFVRASAWGAGGENQDAGVMALRTDKEKYNIGETATISFPAPESGAILLSVEKGQRVLSSRWFSFQPVDGEVKIPLPITAAMTPTAYVSVSIIQPHAQTANDRPIRMYGVVPLNVEDASTRQEVRINMAKQLRSKEKFKIDLATTDGKPTQFTIAVVDEGLLDLTAFKTPDPWKHYFQKLRLGVQTFDIFGNIIGANKGDVLNVFSIGGGVAEEYRQSQLEAGRKKRFKPVSMFKGPIMTDGSGKASVEFDMPNYVGSVRVMVIAATNNRYSHAEKAVPVKTELMVVPSLPRVVGPADKFTIPATVFAMEDNIGNVDVTLSLEGPLKSEVLKKSVRLPEKGEADVFFDVTADPAVGQGKVTIKASSSKFSADSETDLYVRPSSPRIYDDEEQVVDNGGKVTFTIPNRGIAGSNYAEISIRRRPKMNVSNRLMRLIRYPYGCIEQTTSAIFPQLYLADMVRNDEKRQKNADRIQEQVDRNINRGIRRLNRFRLTSGAFTYWPGNRRVSEWGTNYAGHFLIEAKKRGYHVPDDLFSAWLRYQQSMAMNTRQNLKTRTYRVYVLALAGEPVVGAMNLLKENNLKDMDSMEKWLLAGAYKLAGIDRTADQLAKAAQFSFKDYWEFGNTYGSTLRDKAMVMDIQTLFENWSKADEMANELASSLSSQNWYSTQTTAFMLLAIGKYLDALEGSSQGVPKMAGNIILPDGKKVPFDTAERQFNLSITEGFGKELTVELSNNSTLKRAFVNLAWDGIPLRSDVVDENKNLSLSVKWYDEDGQQISPLDLAQGTTFWAHFIVGNINKADLEELALVQVLPSGWEIQNTRLSGEGLPDWLRNLPTQKRRQRKFNRQEYLDIRDDRIMWFFDMGRRDRSLEFAVKLNAITVGDFHLPPTIVEAMYNNNYKATKAGKDVSVRSK